MHPMLIHELILISKDIITSIIIISYNITSPLFGQFLLNRRSHSSLILEPCSSGTLLHTSHLSFTLGRQRPLQQYSHHSHRLFCWNYHGFLQLLLWRTGPQATRNRRTGVSCQISYLANAGCVNLSSYMSSNYCHTWSEWDPLIAPNKRFGSWEI